MLEKRTRKEVAFLLHLTPPWRRKRIEKLLLLVPVEDFQPPGRFI